MFNDRPDENLGEYRFSCLDGWQRSSALKRFLEDEIKLIGDCVPQEYENLTYSQLPNDVQQHFNAIPISICFNTIKDPRYVVQVFCQLNNAVKLGSGEFLNSAGFYGDNFILETAYSIVNVTRDFGYESELRTQARILGKRIRKL